MFGENNIYEVYVFGKIKAQPRPKAARRGKFVSIYNPPTANEWKTRIKTVMNGIKKSAKIDTIEDSVAVYLDFFFERPKSHYLTTGKLKKNVCEKHQQKPDVDNLAKAVLDALTDVGIIYDDKLVDRLLVTKQWCTDNPFNVHSSRESCLITIKKS